MKAPLSDFVIDNDEVKPLIVQVEKVLMELVN
jgi:hypothetical protein